MKCAAAGAKRAFAALNARRSVTELGTLGATTTVVTPAAATKAASIVPYEFPRDLYSYLSSAPEGTAKSLQQVIEYNSANATEGLKFRQNGLLAAEATETTNPTTTATYEETSPKERPKTR